MARRLSCRRGVCIMEHHWFSLMAVTRESEVLEVPRSASAQHPVPRRGKRRKGRGNYISRLVVSSCTALIIGLFALKLVMAGLTAVLWGWGILNLICALGVLVSWWEDEWTAKDCTFEDSPCGSDSCPYRLDARGLGRIVGRSLAGSDPAPSRGQGAATGPPPRPGGRGQAAAESCPGSFAGVDLPAPQRAGEWRGMGSGLELSVG